MRRALEKFSSPVSRWVRKELPLLLAISDAVVWSVAVPLATLVRYDFNIVDSTAPGIRGALLVVVSGHCVAGLAVGTYRRKWVYGTFDEMLAHVSTVLIAGVGLQTYGFIVGPSELPRSVPTIATFLTINLTVTVRSTFRLVRQRIHRLRDAEPVVVVGAGNAAEQVIRTLLSDERSPLRPVAIVDDSSVKQSLRINGVSVRGKIGDLPDVIAANAATHVLMAIPSASRDLLQRVHSLADASAARLLVLPPLDKMFGAVDFGDIRPVQPEDLLGRPEVELDRARLSALLDGRCVLVTGAGGSIGSELCRQISQFSPGRLVMLDRDESGLHSTQLLIDGHGLLDSPNIVLADIRDTARVNEVFDAFRPHVVFHAAALKHMPLLEAHPSEGWKTNVEGTFNVLRAAENVGVNHFINISTDKAANPSNVLGRCKRLTERLTSEFGLKNPGSWVSVRFGNVLGSRGSVLTTFRAQVETGGPITVTHPDVTRFFMTVAEAVRLTIYSGAIGNSGQVLVLDMGGPVKILDVAKRFANLVDPPIEITFSGLRPGEKLHEVLLGDDEVDSRPSHPFISQVEVPPVRFDELSESLILPTTMSVSNGI